LRKNDVYFLVGLLAIVIALLEHAAMASGHANDEPDNQGQPNSRMLKYQHDATPRGDD
jgi:hypothetical protein